MQGVFELCASPQNKIIVLKKKKGVNQEDMQSQSANKHLNELWILVNKAQLAHA